MSVAKAPTAHWRCAVGFTSEQKLPCLVAISQGQQDHAVVPQAHGVSHAAGIVLPVEYVLDVQGSTPARGVVGDADISQYITRDLVGIGMRTAGATHAAIELPTAERSAEAIARCGIESLTRHVVEPLTDGGRCLPTVVGNHRSSIGIAAHDAQAILEVGSKAEFKAA